MSEKHKVVTQKCRNSSYLMELFDVNSNSSRFLKMLHHCKSFMIFFFFVLFHENVYTVRKSPFGGSHERVFWIREGSK